MGHPNSLLERWGGDIEPTATLAARYQKNKYWKNKMPVLARLFDSALNHTFENYKFHGWPGDTKDITQAQRQLSMLKTPAQIAAWKKPRSLLESYPPQLTPSQRVQDAQDTIREKWDHLMTPP